MTSVTMKIAIASDHAGFKLKEALKHFLKSQKYDVVDFGTSSESPVDYPEFGRKVSESILSGDVTLGVLVCGSGIGMCITANRFKGIRAVVLNDEFDVDMGRRHNDANVACFGARKIKEATAIALLSKWLATAFEGGRHKKRIEKLEQ